MASTIVTKNSSTASAVPVTGDLTQGELAVNVTDKRLFTKNSGGTVVELGTNPASLALPNGTANGVAYLNGSKVVTTGSALTFDGTNLTTPSLITTTDASGLATFGRFSSGYTWSLIRPSTTATGIEFRTFTGDALYQLDQTSGSNKHIWYTAGSEQMRLTSTGLGIGTSSPSQKLSVTGNGTFTGYVTAGGGGSGLRVDGVLMADRDQDNNITLIGGADNTLRLRTGSTTRATIDSSGNLGLGVTPSAWSGLKGLQNGRASLAGQSSEGAWLTNNAFYNGTNWVYMTSSQATMYQQLSGVQSWHTAASGTAGNAITFTQAMTLDASGNLGLGTTSPKANSGYATLTLNNATNGGVVQFTQADTTIGQLFFDGNGGTLRTSGSTSLVFGTANTERARITSGGYFKASNNGTYLGSTASYHEFASNVSNSTLWITNSNATPYGFAATYTSVSPNNTTSEFIACADTLAQRATIRSNGGLANYSANNVNLSDQREKTNFAPAGDYLSKICAIPVKTFNYIDQNLEDDPGTTLGVVAQDVQAIAPELVVESNWGTEDAPKMRLSIYQTDLQYALMKALQELKAEFDAYKATHP